MTVPAKPRTFLPGREVTVEKIDRRIRELWQSHGRILPQSTPGDYARLWRQIDALLDKRLELTA